MPQSASMQVLTIPERQALEAERRRQAAQRIKARLADYGRRRGGRFHVFGSAATGRLRFDSDIDILVDFPPEAEDEAWSFAESVCAEEEMPADILSALRTSPRFKDRLRPELETLGA